jgi:hypothetical protein
MKEIRYPTFLEARPKILLGLNRTDLVLAGGLYLCISYLKIGGIQGLALLAGTLVVFKFVSGLLPPAFFQLWTKNKHTYDWTHQLKRDDYEEN